MHASDDTVLNAGARMLDCERVGRGTGVLAVLATWQL
jgi:hypothetical protein